MLFIVTIFSLPSFAESKVVLTAYGCKIPLEENRAFPQSKFMCMQAKQFEHFRIPDKTDLRSIRVVTIFDSNNCEISSGPFVPSGPQTIFIGGAPEPACFFVIWRPLNEK
jgi:hypothetical protein